MKYLSICILFFLLSCAQREDQKIGEKITFKDSSNSVEKKENGVETKEDSLIENEQVDARKDLISEYSKPLIIDTSFRIGNKNYRILFRHYCLMDSSIRVPAKYNFDTNKDFVTHNFVSKLTLLYANDTLFHKEISKSMFNSFLDSNLKKYASLSFTDFNLIKDSIKIDYSISIPATDVGMGASISFSKNGNYRISQN